MAFLTGYTTRRKITIDSSKIDATLTDFPILIKLTSANFDFAKANADGFDIRFTSSDGTTLLKYERERHDNANSLAEYWVKVPSISSSVDTDIYIYYKTADTADGADQTNVWDTNHKMVQHLKDLTTSTTEDSTANNNDGTKYAANQPIEANAKIAKAQSFDGVNDYVATGLISDLPTTEITISVWQKVTAAVRQATFQLDADLNTDRINAHVPWSDGIVYWDFGDYTTTGRLSYTPPSSIVGTWQYFTFVASQSGNYMKIYRNGAEEATKVGMDAYSGTSRKFTLGHHAFTDYFGGLIDEVRVSNIARSASWIKADYNSGNDTLNTYGSEELSAVTFIPKSIFYVFTPQLPSIWED